MFGLEDQIKTLRKLIKESKKRLFESKIELYPMTVVINFFFFAISFHTMHFFVVECLLFFYATHLMVSKSEEKFVLKMSRHGFIRAMETWSV